MNNLHQAQSHDVLRSWQSQRADFNHHKDFVLPLFISNDDYAIEPIESMPGVFRYGCATVIDYLEPLVYVHGLRAVLLFPVITRTDHAKLKSIHNSDEDDDDDDDEVDARSSPYDSSSSESFSAPSNSSEEVVRKTSTSKGPDRLPNEPVANANQSQNPFLDRNEEEEDHLLGDHTNRVAPNERTMLPQVTVINHANSAMPPNPSQGFKKISKSIDVKLIKNLALKEEYNAVLRIIPKLRANFPELLIICDVCLCAFTSTGHCCVFGEGLVVSTNNQGGTTFNNHHLPGYRGGSTTLPISNRLTCQYLATLATEYALRGCNVVAPSDMMDGRILTIRKKLDENNLTHVAIMSYAAKFASAFYGPFRQATHNAPEFGDRKSYQLPPGSRALALKAVRRDIEQGADIVMVKPGGPYLDIVRDIREEHPEYPIAIYQVSGEFSMLKMGAKANILDLRAAVNEMMTAYRRAGATIIISYFTPEILKGEL